MADRKIKKVRDFLQDCMKLDKLAFQNQFGSGFLISHEDETELNDDSDRRLQPNTMTQTADHGLPLQGGLDLAVFPVRPGTHKDPGKFISVGRYSGNDVVIPFESISRIQVLCLPGPDRPVLHPGRRLQERLLHQRPHHPREGQGRLGGGPLGATSSSAPGTSPSCPGPTSTSSCCGRPPPRSRENTSAARSMRHKT